MSNSCLEFIFNFQDNKRIAPPKAFSSVKFAVFFIEDENKYLTIPSSSTLYPKCDMETIQPLMEVELTDRIVNFKGLFIAQSESKSEINAIQEKLQRHIDEGHHIDCDASLRFLNESFSVQTSKSEPVPELKAGPSESNKSDIIRASNCDLDSSTFNETSDTNVASSSFDSLQLKLINKSIVKCHEVLKEVLKEQVTTRKILQRAFPKSPKTIAPVCDIEEATVEPVLHNGTNLLKVGQRNADSIRYSLSLARELWTDQELAERRLYPKRNNQSLSPDRSGKFRTCLFRRFGIEDEEDFQR